MSDRQPKVSVCLPTFNRAGYLKDTLRSILAQTLVDFELIVSDNCSTDETAEILGAVTDPRVRYVRNDTNIGHYRNMNRCLEMARGEFVCIVHDDDVYQPAFLAEEVEALTRNPRAAMVHCAVVMVDAQLRPLRLHRVHGAARVANGLDEFTRYLGGHDVCCSTVMMRRDAVRSAGPFVPELMCADWLMWLRLALVGDVAYVAQPLVRVRVHATSMTSTMDPERWYREFLEVVEQGLKTRRARYPESSPGSDAFLRPAFHEQAKRFAIAGLAAAAEGEGDLARRHLNVIRQMEGHGAPRRYRLALQAFLSTPAKILLRPVRQLRRMLARTRTAGALVHSEP